MHPYGAGVVVGGRREAGPILTVLLIFDLITLTLGAVCMGIGVKMGSSLDSVSSAATSFWWGGLTLLILGVFYIPCHILVKMGNPAGRVMFVFWTFMIGIGVIFILISAGITAYVYSLVNDVPPDNCVYFEEFNPSQTPCYAACLSALGSVPARTCCCCESTYSTTSDVIYAKNVDSCDLFKSAIDLAKPLAFLYIASVIVVFIDMVMAYVVACGCCDVQTPWFVQPTPMVTTTNVVMASPGQVQTAPVAYPPSYDQQKQPYA